MSVLRIGNVEIKRTAALAPMAGVADFAFRYMAKKFGAAYVVGEMVSCKGLVYGDKKSRELLLLGESERPAAVQLFGAEPLYMAKAVQIASEYNPDIIDINSGCPVPKVVNSGAGSALMKTPKLLGEIVSAAVKATSIPITVKIRAGWDSDNINAVEIAKIAENSGAAAITVHGRTKTQMYSGKADREIIRKVKESVSIPVIANGDVHDYISCKSMYEETGCDLVMIGRAAYGNPWVFKEINDYFGNGTIMNPPTLEEKLTVMTTHIEFLVKEKGEYIGMKEARKHTAWYLKGLHGAAKFRNICGKLSTLDDFYKLIDDLKEIR